MININIVDDIMIVYDHFISVAVKIHSSMIIITVQLPTIGTNDRSNVLNLDTNTHFKLSFFFVCS